MMIAAQIGPIPTMSHRVVPEVDTAVVMRALEAFNAVSKPVMSVMSSLAMITR